MDTEPALSLHSRASSASSSRAGGGGGGGGSMPTATVLQNEQAVVRRAGRQAIRQFLESHNCFAVLRTSGKVVVFDTRIPIQLAFYALVEHDMLAAPLWDPVKCQFVGLLTVTDFIDILRHYRSYKKDVSALAVSSIDEILSQLSDEKEENAEEQHGRNDNDPSSAGSVASSNPRAGGASATAAPISIRSFNGADSACTLRQACEQLLKTGQDFLPIVFAEDMRVLACITFTSILEHLVTHFREQRRLFDDSITDLGIGTYGTDIVTVNPQQTLADALELMHRHTLSALPVVDQATNKILGVYSRSDITFLTKATDAEDAVRNLDLQVGEILAQTRVDVTTPDALRTCSPTHTLQAIFESFAQLKFNRLYVVDAEERLLGAVSARDLVAYFLSTDSAEESNTEANGQGMGGFHAGLMP